MLEQAKELLDIYPWLMVPVAIAAALLIQFVVYAILMVLFSSTRPPF
jgi:hypothetical protein